MAGLLEMLGVSSGDPAKDNALNQGLLSFGLNLMSSKRGNLAGALGEAGLAGLGTANQGLMQARSQGIQDKQLKFQEQQQAFQTAQQQAAEEARKKQQAFFDQLPSPQMQATEAALSGGGGPSPANAARMQPVDPMAQLMYGAAKAGVVPFPTYLQSLQKETAPLKVGANERLLDPRTFKVLLDAQPDPAKQSSLGQLIAEMNTLPEGDPRRAIYQQAIAKTTTHAPATSVTTYGSPVPYTLPDGGVGYVQPGNKPGAAPMVMADPKTGKPFTKPADASTKAPTEFEAKAGLYFKSMDTASKVLDDAEQTNAWRPGIAESIAPEGAAKTFATSEPRQKYTQAQMQWIDSINRVRSGANLPEIEYNRAVRTFFPVIGEGEAIKKQKAAARKQEEQAMRTAAGKALPQGQSAMPDMSAIDAEIARRARGGN